MLGLLLVLFACSRPDPCESGCDSPVDSVPSDSSPDSETTAIQISDALVLSNGRPTNLLVISVDTLRYDHVNRLGYGKRTTTPTLDGLAAAGVSLDEHRTCSSWTLPSTLCALTGMDQLTLGHWPANNDGLPPVTPDWVTLLAERFQTAGFYTMLSGGSGFLGQSSNMDQGYDAGFSVFDISATQVVDDAVTLLAGRPVNQPWFMHVHFLDPHMPYTPPEAYLGELDLLEPTPYDLTTKEGTLELWKDYPDLPADEQELNMEHMLVRYDGEIRYADDETARLMDTLEQQGLLDQTLVLFYVDHGEEFQEHLNFNHGYTAYDEIVRVWAFFNWAGGLEPGVVSTPTLHEDLVPTLLAIYDIPSDDGFAGEIVGASTREHVYNLTWRLDRTYQSVVKDGLKLSYRWDGDTTLGGPKYLYDLAADPYEQNNLYSADDQRVIALWGDLMPEVERMMEAEPEYTPVVAPGP